MRQFTDPDIDDGDVNKALHVTELRKQIMMASLFMPHLDERPVYNAFSKSIYQVGTFRTALELTGSGVIRSIWGAVNLSGRIKITVDGVVRVDTTLQKFVFVHGGCLGNFQSKYHGRSNDGGYRNVPIPFHTSIKVETDLGFYNILYNYSPTVDFNYGRFNQFNFAEKTISASDENLVNISGKAGAYWGMYMSIPIAEDQNEIETQTVYTVDGGTPNKNSGTEDLFFSSYGWTGWGIDPNETFPVPAMLQTSYWPALIHDSMGVTNHGAIGTNRGLYRYFDMAPLNFDSSFSISWGQYTADYISNGPAWNHIDHVDTHSIYYTAT